MHIKYKKGTKMKEALKSYKVGVNYSIKKRDYLRVLETYFFDCFYRTDSRVWIPHHSQTRAKNADLVTLVNLELLSLEILSYT